MEHGQQHTAAPKRLPWERETFKSPYASYDSPSLVRYVARMPEAVYTVTESGKEWTAKVSDVPGVSESLWSWDSELSAKLQCEAHYESLMARLSQPEPIEFGAVA
jgi:hypothetical protein